MSKKSKSKGKAPTGRAGKKAKVQRNSPAVKKYGSNGSQGHAKFADSDDDDDYDLPARLFKGFAQATPRNGAVSFDPAVKLRHQTIAFVSAGTNTPTVETPPVIRTEESVVVIDQDEVEVVSQEIIAEGIGGIVAENTVPSVEEVPQRAMANMTIHGHNNASQDDMNAAVIGESHNVHSATSGAPEVGFVIDTVGDTSLIPATPSIANKDSIVRSTSPALSSSSEEVVVFHGRTKPRVVDDPVPQQQQPAHAPVSTIKQPSLNHKSTTSDAAFPDVESGFKPTGGWATQPSKYDLDVNLNATWAPAPEGKWWRKQQTPITAEATIAQLQSDWKNVLREKTNQKNEKKKVLQDSGEIKLIASTSRRRKRGGRKDNRGRRNGSASGDGFDDALDAAFEDYLQNMDNGSDTAEMAAFLNVNSAHNAALGGPSMVVDGKGIDDDEILADAKRSAEDDDESSDDKIGLDVEELSMLGDGLSGTSDIDSSELEEALEYTEQQQWEDEDDLRQRRLDAMSDEQIARLLAKQEELGIDDDELILDDGSWGLGHEGAGDIAAARAAAAKLQRSTPQHRRGRKSNGPTFVDATMLADIVEQYGEGGFDIMDFDRPSLRATKKGRKGRLPPELEALSDDDLRDSMAQTWDNDRAKKKQKKAEREILRAEGLLGSSNARRSETNVDLRTKYPLGMSTVQINIELRTFLAESTATTLPFPPMGKHDRAQLHEIASALGLKSKSAGSGNTRYPVLYRTAATHSDATQIDAATFAADRGWLGWRNALRRAGRAPGRNGNGPGRGGGTGAATIRNGEIVGAGADEIGKENFGHRMMERMGWSKGQALGKDGEGRLAPVEQIMRSGRAGLG